MVSNCMLNIAFHCELTLIHLAALFAISECSKTRANEDVEQESRECEDSSYHKLPQGDRSDGLCTRSEHAIDSAQEDDPLTANKEFE